MAKKSGKNKGYSYKYNKSKTVTCRKYYTMPNGIRKQLVATGNTEEDSRKKLDEKYANICKQGKQLKSNGYTVKTWCQYWLGNIKTNLKGSTKDRYYSAFKNHIYPNIGNIKLKSLTLELIQKTINKVNTTVIIKNGNSNKITGKTVKEIVSPLKQSLKYAMATGKMPYISLELLALPKVIKGTRPIRNQYEQQIITDYFCNRIPNNPFDLYYAPIVIMDARGLRPEEVSGLQWIDINYENNSFVAGNHTVVRNGIYDENGNKIGAKIVVEDSGKTPNAVRDLPLGNFLSNIFKNIYQQYIDNGIIPKETDFIFHTKIGTLFYEKSLRKMYKSLSKKLQISDIGCYSLRHEYLTFLAQETDIDQESIKRLAGWSQIVPTYFHTDDKHIRKATNIVDKQYEDNTLLVDDTVTTVGSGNIIQFPLKSLVMQ